VSVVAQKLRPAKIRSAMRRRWFEWRLARLPVEPGPPIVRLGSAYGGWTIPDNALGEGDICYCVGAGADVSFDVELIHRYGAVVRAVDPVKSYEDEALRQAAGDPRFSLRVVALATRDGPVRMQSHHERSSASLSAAGLYETDEWTEVPGLTLTSLMREFGDDHIDLLKVDVEGLEYELVPTLDLVALGVRVFALQLHHVGSVHQAARMIEGVRRQGYQVVARWRPGKVAFVRASAVTSIGLTG
jgi:FkbM family methyltransferase